VSSAVVIVSGGGAISPFTTPTAGCGAGLSAGSTDTGLREGLLAHGFAVYTSPANVGNRPVTHDPDFGGFSDPPDVLPVELTVNAAGPIDTAGERLAAFLTFLAEREGLSRVHLVAHSMGGLFSRAAIRVLREQGSTLQIASLVTLGTPWNGSYAADHANGDLPLSVAAGDPVTEQIMADFVTLRNAVSGGAAEQVTRRYLTGDDGWNERQRGVLDGIPLTILAGDHFRHDGGDAAAWPHDGLVQLRSAVAEGVSPGVAAPRHVQVFPDVHSIYFAEPFGLPWERALTWDPDVRAAVVAAIRSADAALQEG
jgi:pimeloyl-ACP methyl ester carboxylesterase